MTLLPNLVVRKLTHYIIALYEEGRECPYTGNTGGVKDEIS